VTTTIITTSNGHIISTVLTSSSVVTASTSKATSAPGLNGGSGANGSSGLSSSSKKIIIGVVVGIGGAILLGALAVVGWRIWGKKRNAEGDDDIYDPNDTSKDRSNASSEISPFKQALDQYHQPSQVNTSSNF